MSLNRNVLIIFLCALLCAAALIVFLSRIVAADPIGPVTLGGRITDFQATYKQIAFDGTATNVVYTFQDTVALSQIAVALNVTADEISGTVSKIAITSSGMITAGDPSKSASDMITYCSKFFPSDYKIATSDISLYNSQGKEHVTYTSNFAGNFSLDIAPGSCTLQKTS